MDKLTLAQLAWRGNHHPSPVRRSGLGLRIYSYCTTTIQYYYYNTTTVCTVPFQSCNIRYNTILCYIIYTVLDNSNHSKHSPSSILHQPPTPTLTSQARKPQLPNRPETTNSPQSSIIHRPSSSFRFPPSVHALRPLQHINTPGVVCFCLVSRSTSYPTPGADSQRSGTFACLRGR